MKAKLTITLDDETRPIWQAAKRAAADVAAMPDWKRGDVMPDDRTASERADDRRRRIERLELIAEAVAHSDEGDRIGEIKVDDSGLVAYLRDYARAALGLP